MKKVRVRFAPSPTGGLHLGGVRTVLFNYLFAKSQGGDFIVRIEDTDQTRFVPGAEAYIFQCLEWCGLVPDESPIHGGPHAPYRQSERKAIYRGYAEQLVAAGQAYYAFDTPEALEQMREQYKTAENPSPQYNHHLRQYMRNSLTLPAAEVDELLNNGTPYVIRIKMPADETVTLTDMIRGEVSFHTSQVDDKVLLKADGMPTYHLAVVVDDYLMQITHAFRGEEWLPSAPVHVKLWEYLFGLAAMPQWAHLPLILKPDGNGKLSKRDGDRLGFPVFAMDWTDPKTGETTTGFRERGFLPDAFVNMLAVLGWNDGSEREIYTREALLQHFSLDRVHKGGAKFNWEKAQWFNHEWIKQNDASLYAETVKDIFKAQHLTVNDDAYFVRVLNMVKDRCTFLPDFVEQASFFFTAPTVIDIEAIKGKWNEQQQQFFEALVAAFTAITDWEHDAIDAAFKATAAAQQVKAGQLMLPLRVMLVGGKFGPGVLDIATMIGKQATIERIQHVLTLL